MKFRAFFLVLYKFLLSGRNIIIYDYHGLCEYQKEFDTLITLQLCKCQIFKKQCCQICFLNKIKFSLKMIDKFKALEYNLKK